jgi:hypothetical protein
MKKKASMMNQFQPPNMKMVRPTSIAAKIPPSDRSWNLAAILASTNVAKIPIKKE